jgi:hypothetical protein
VRDAYGTARGKLKTTGYLLLETELVIVIATLKTRNRKTGDMLQVWILNRHESPVSSVKTGSDANICFDCPARGFKGKKRICYVPLRSPQAIWRKYTRGGYAFLRPEDYARVFGGRKVRFGAYGEPVVIPFAIVAAISSVAQGRTGYTHQWLKPEFQVFRSFVMASCDSELEQRLAVSMGWRTFRTRSKYDPLLAGEITCPASDEAGKRTTCANCLLCNGSSGPRDARKNITIIVHGTGAKNFVPLTAIGAAA